jgi:hypothetical protein
MKYLEEVAVFFKSVGPIWKQQTTIRAAIQMVTSEGLRYGIRLYVMFSCTKGIVSINKR